MELFKMLLKSYFAVFIILIYLFILLITNKAFNKKTNKYIIYSIVSLFCYAIFELIKEIVKTNNYSINLRLTLGIILIIISPLPVLFFNLIFVNNKKITFKNYFYIPIIINAIIALTGFFSKIAFYYNDDELFVRTLPLGYFQFVVCIFYMVLLLFFIMRNYKRNFKESIITFVLALSLIFAAIMEMCLNIRSILVTTASVVITFYYMYLLQAQGEVDYLTGCYLRRKLVNDYEKNKSKIKYICFIDINNLKQINDTKGHAEGDAAITYVTNLIYDNLPKHTRIYRVGGDEFVCFLNIEHEQMKKISDGLFEISKISKYSFAFGYTQNNLSKNLEDLISDSDNIMYENKSLLKK